MRPFAEQKATLGTTMTVKSNMQAGVEDRTVRRPIQDPKSKIQNPPLKKSLSLNLVPLPLLPQNLAREAFRKATGETLTLPRPAPRHPASRFLSKTATPAHYHGITTQTGTGP
jgi:hypothetical protein